MSVQTQSAKPADAMHHVTARGRYNDLVGLAKATPHQYRLGTGATSARMHFVGIAESSIAVKTAPP